MEFQLAEVAWLRRSLLDDMFKEFNTSRRKWVRRLLEPIAWPSVTRFARIAATFDQYVANYGFREGMQRILPFFVGGMEISGAEYVPAEGPLLVVSNHPGTYDSLVITAGLPRNDLNIVASGYPFLQNLPSASQHMIFTTNEIHSRMAAVRCSIRHLRNGGSLLIFPGGRVEPDPASLPGATEAIKNWSPSIELLLRKVPQTRVLVTIVSGVLAPFFLRSPLIKLWRGTRDPQTVAEALQVITQMLFPKMVNLIPRISFGSPLTFDDLDAATGEYQSVINSVIDKARGLLTEHCTEIGVFEAG
jgi:hypothetical protein